jgi:HK97 family phage major capsid protein
MPDYIQRQIEERARAWEQAKALLDHAASENRDLDASETEQFNRINEDLDRRAAIVKDFVAAEAREAEVRAATEGRPEARPVEARQVPVDDDSVILRKLAMGEIRSHSFERRDVLTSSTGAPVPTSFYDQIQTVARYVGPMLETSTTIATSGGETLQIPRTNAYSTGTVTAQGSNIGNSDPTFLAFLSLSAFKYSFTVQLSTEMLSDSGVDILGYLGTNVGQALGYAVNAGLTTGVGTTEPTGIVTSAGSGLSGTAVAGFSTNNVIDLVYSLNAAVRAMPGFAIMGGTSATASARKLTDTTGQYLWQPSLQLGQPDRLLGYKFIENPHMATPAADAKSLIAGDLKSYLVRTAGGIELARSDDFAFAEGLVTFRATFRVDGGLPQSSHVKYFRNPA